MSTAWFAVFKDKINPIESENKVPSSLVGAKMLMNYFVSHECASTLYHSHRNLATSIEVGCILETFRKTWRC